MTTAGVCPRCGRVVSIMHPRPECDAFYDAAYKAAQTTFGVPGLDPHDFVTVLGPSRVWGVPDDSSPRSRRVDFTISNLTATPDEEDVLVDAMWAAASGLHPDADLLASSGPDEEAATDAVTLSLVAHEKASRASFEWWCGADGGVSWEKESNEVRDMYREAVRVAFAAVGIECGRQIEGSR